MKKALAILVMVLIMPFARAQTPTSVHSYTALAIDSTVFNFNSYYGKKILIFNAASLCVYTPQYADLEMLYQTYKSSNFEILGFPCNDFGAQEPGKDSSINAFCMANYGVTFKMMSKISITAMDTSPVYQWLQRGSLNGVASNAVNWNFNKFCIDELGRLVKWHPSTVVPLDTAITNWIMKPSVITTAISENDLHTELLSQNPASGSVSILIKNNSPRAYSIDLYSAEGKLVRTVSEKNLSSKQISFSVSDLSPGIYFVRVQNETVKKDLKLIITQ